LTVDKETEPLETTATEQNPDSEESSAEEETAPKADNKPDVAETVVEDAASSDQKDETSGDAEAKTDTGDSGQDGSKAENSDSEDKPSDHQGKDRSRSRGEGRHSGGHGRRGDRPLTNEEKLRLYKKQSEERLLDIKRSREAKVGKKKK